MAAWLAGSPGADAPRRGAASQAHSAPILTCCHAYTSLTSTCAHAAAGEAGAEGAEGPKAGELPSEQQAALREQRGRPTYVTNKSATGGPSKSYRPNGQPGRTGPPSLTYKGYPTGGQACVSIAATDCMRLLAAAALALLSASPLHQQQ